MSESTSTQPAPEPAKSTTPTDSTGSRSDSDDLAALGYQQQLRRTMSPFTAFALAFSMVSINTGIVTLFADPYEHLGGAAVFLWLPAILLVLTLVAVYAHLAGRMPITGYAYQWASRLVGPNFGWFTGWIALISFVAGTAGTAAAVGTVFAPEIWADPSPRQVQALSIGCTILVAILNIVGVKLATRINNIGASIELVGTIILGIVLVAGVLVLFGHTEGPRILTETRPISGESVTLTGVALAAMLPVYVLLGWEGAADLAEETVNPRKAAPRAMFRAVIVSGIIGFAIFALLGMALPAAPATFLTGPENPVLKLIATHLGPFARALMIVVAFASIFACLIANMAVATRMTFALSRDNMLPGSRGLRKVGGRSRAPIRAIVLVAVVAIGLNLLNEGIVGRIYAMVGLTYYLVYGLTLFATALAARRGRIPAASPRCLRPRTLAESRRRTGPALVRLGHRRPHPARGQPPKRHHRRRRPRRRIPLVDPRPTPPPHQRHRRPTPPQSHLRTHPAMTPPTRPQRPSPTNIHTPAPQSPNLSYPPGRIEFGGTPRRIKSKLTNRNLCATKIIEIPHHFEWHSIPSSGNVGFEQTSTSRISGGAQ